MWAVQVKAGESATAAASSLAQAIGTATANATAAALGQVAVTGDSVDRHQCALGGLLHS